MNKYMNLKYSLKDNTKLIEPNVNDLTTLLSILQKNEDKSVENTTTRKKKEKKIIRKKKQKQKQKKMKKIARKKKAKQVIKMKKIKLSETI